MTRTQIQLPDPLFKRLHEIAAEKDLSFAELVRRGMETYAATFPGIPAKKKKWEFPILPGSGGHKVDPATISPEADAIEMRGKVEN